VLIEGRLKLDTWEKDGQKRSKLKVVAETMQMLGGRGGQGGGGPGGGGEGRGRGSAPREDEYGGDESYSEARPSAQRAPARSAAPPADDIPF
jgi:single-strand DNA-binding protein